MLGNDPEEMLCLALCLYLAQGAGTVSAGGRVKIPEHSPAASLELPLTATGEGISGLPSPGAREVAKKQSTPTPAPSNAPAPGQPHLPSRGFSSPLKLSWGKHVPAPVQPCPAGRGFSWHRGEAMPIYQPHTTSICTGE